MFALLFCLLFIGDNVSSVWSIERGVQIRLTQAALDYVLKVELEKLEQKLHEKELNREFKNGRDTYKLSDTRIVNVRFPNHRISLVPGKGLQVEINGASIKIDGKLRYKYHWGLVSLSDKIGITAKASNVDFKMTIAIETNIMGQPTISGENCHGYVGSVNLDFHGRWSFVYDIFSGIFESSLKKTLNKEICKLAMKAIETDAKNKLSTFRISKQIDDWAILDYRMVHCPVYTSKYADVYIMGEFKDAKNPKGSSLPFTSFVDGNDASRMVYFWLSEYTANTAGEVYHKSGRLDFKVQPWTFETPETIKNLLNTKRIRSIAPSLFEKYPDLGMGIHFKSHKPPRCEISEDGIRFFIYVDTNLTVNVGSTVVALFGMKLDLDTTVGAQIADERIVLQIKDDTFEYSADVHVSFKDIVNIPLNNNWVQGIVRTLILKYVNEQLLKGLPLPNLNNVAFPRAKIDFQKHAIRISSDLIAN